MSRTAAGDVIIVKPANNIYTVMAIVGTLVQVLALVVIVARYKSVFGVFIFQS